MDRCLASTPRRRRHAFKHRGPRVPRRHQNQALALLPPAHHPAEGSRVALLRLHPFGRTEPTRQRQWPDDQPGPVLRIAAHEMIHARVAIHTEPLAAKFQAARLPAFRRGLGRRATQLDKDPRAARQFLDFPNSNLSRDRGRARRRVGGTRSRPRGAAGEHKRGTQDNPSGDFHGVMKEAPAYPPARPTQPVPRAAPQTPASGAPRPRARAIVGRLGRRERRPSRSGGAPRAVIPGRRGRSPLPAPSVCKPGWPRRKFGRFQPVGHHRLRVVATSCAPGRRETPTSRKSPARRSSDSFTGSARSLARATKGCAVSSPR